MAVLDWQTITPAREIGKVFAYVELPTFAVVGLVWKGASEIVRQYNFTASKNFTIRMLPDAPAGVDYCLVIRYRIGAAVYRFKLWEGVGEVLNERLYANDIIRGNFVLEIWSTAATTATNTDIVEIPLSIQSIVTDFSEAPVDVVDAEGAVVPIEDLLSTGVSRPPTAAPYLIGLQGWWKATSLSPGAVSLWADLSGNGRTLTQATGAQQPVTDGVSVTFAAGDNLAYGLGFVAGDVFVVLKINTFVAGSVILEDDYVTLALSAVDGFLKSTFYATDATVSWAGGDLFIARFTGSTVLPNLLGNSLKAYHGSVVYSSELVPTAQVVPNVAGSFFRLGKSTNGACAISVYEVLAYSSLAGGTPETTTLQYLSDTYFGAAMTLPLTFNPAGPFTTNPP